jgi:hypothetical protein
LSVKALLLDLFPVFAADPKRNGLNDNLGLGYIAAHGRSVGFEVEILGRGTTRFTPDEIVDYITKRSYDVIGISLAQARTAITQYVVRQLRERGCTAHLTLGGYFPTFAPRACLDAFPEVDSLILHEGEYTFSSLLTALAEDQPLILPGLMTRDAFEQGTFQHRPHISNLDELPFPDRPSLVSPSEVTWFYSSRGCSHNCSFCSVPRFYGRSGWRPRSVGNVISEIEYLVEKRGVREIQFCDDNFLCGAAGVKRARQITTELIERDIDITFGIECRLDVIDHDLMKHLKRAGLKMALVGIESLDKPTQQLFNKPIDQTQLDRALQILDALDIEVRMGFINYHPLSTLTSIQCNNAFLLSRLRSNKTSPYETFQRLSNSLQPFLGMPLNDELESFLSLTPSLRHEMQFQDPEVAKLWEIVYMLRTMLAELTHRLRFTYLSDHYTPERVKRCETIIDEVHTIGCDILDHFTNRLGTENNLSEEEATQHLLVLNKRIETVNKKIEQYLDEFADAIIYRIHSFTEQGKHYIYAPNMEAPRRISKETFDVIYRWRYEGLREKMREKRGSATEQVFAECKQLLELTSTWHVKELVDTRNFINPFFMLTALRILEN